MEVILLFFLIFVLPELIGYLIVYLIDALKGKTPTAINHQNQKMYESIDFKIKNNEPLTIEEKRKIKEDMSLYELMYDLEVRNINLNKENSNGGISSNSVVSEINDRLNKIMWFNSSNEWFNYGVVKGYKQYNNMRTEELITLQHLLFRVGTEKGYYVGWLYNPDSFSISIKQALSWSNNKQTALIFKFKPSEEVIVAKVDFDFYMHKYIKYKDDDSYNCMYETFKKLYNLLGKY